MRLRFFLCPKHLADAKALWVDMEFVCIPTSVISSYLFFQFGHE